MCVCVCVCVFVCTRVCAITLSTNTLCTAASPVGVVDGKSATAPKVATKVSPPAHEGVEHASASIAILEQPWVQASSLQPIMPVPA